MGLKLLKRLSCANSTSKQSERDELAAVDKPVEDTETSSESSSCRTTLSAIGIEIDGLARSGKFDKVLKRISRSKLEDWRPDEDIASDSDDNLTGTEHKQQQSWPLGVSTPLHLILSHKPPVPIIESLISLLKTKFDILVPEEFPDHLGRTALHVAVINGCPEEICQCLMSGDMLFMPALHVDETKRTPLHYACLPIPSKKRSRKMAMAEWHQKQVTALLVREFPEASYMRDSLDKTPLCYARESNLAMSVPSLERERLVCESKIKKDGVEAASVDAPLVDFLPTHVPGVPNDDDDLSTIVDIGL
jgi:hypothetical protein